MKQKAPGLRWLAPVVIVVAIFFASMPWLKDMNETIVLIITAVVMVFVLSWANLFSWRQERALDEVQLAGQRFAQTKGAHIGNFIAILLLVPTPLQNGIINGLINFTTDPGEPVDGHTVHMAITFGMVAVILLQSLGTVVANAFWNRRIGVNAPDGN